MAILKAVSLAVLLLIGTPIVAQSIDPISEILKAGGVAGLEITVIVMGAFITVMLIRMFGANSKSMERRIDNLIEANEKFIATALGTIEMIDRMRQENIQHYFADAKQERAELRTDVNDRLAAAEKKLDMIIERCKGE